MAKVRKFDTPPVQVEVEYLPPFRGRLFGALAWVFLVRLKKFNLAMGNETVCSFCRLAVPRFAKGGGADEE